jgi:two-component system, cell cycle sensor histidine kinase and response regulator CckA
MVAKIFESQCYTTMVGTMRYGFTMRHGDLVILGVMMPRENRKEVHDELIGIDPRVRAIFLSGYTGDVILSKGIRSNNVDFLQKPLSMVGLLAKVREVLDR